MDSKVLYICLNEVDDEILERSERETVSHTVTIRRKLFVMLAAAILGLFLMGAGIATALYGDSIQSWLGHYWEIITGQPMNDQHTLLIDQLSQEIGLSETVAGVTVTVDSAIVGEGRFIVLLRVEGLEFSEKHEYGFEEMQVELAPGTAEDMLGLFYSSGYNFWGLDADGSALFLIYCDYPVKDEPQTEKSPYTTLNLSMTNFSQNPKTNNSMLLTKGEWHFTFSLDRNEIDIKRLPDTQVTGFYYSEDYEEIQVPIVLTNMKLSNTGLTFRYYRYDSQGRDLYTADTSDLNLWVVLKSGQEIDAGCGSVHNPIDGISYHDYKWKLPVDLDEVVAVRIGEVVIPIE